MMARLLFWLLVVCGVLWVVKRMRTAIRPPAGFRRQVTGRMVRDRVCQTFLPEDRALKLASGSEVHYFCSPACRERFLASRTGRRAAGQ
jgi:YHS domain-containing protein